ncbi:lysophospholipase D GDPD3a isoform X2 [Osmerus eperlanus]|uniref:lysophospholipase D GDPD3a isoform X2 n=1 Tax=Osmerus eperlanus TaxID=29151 RepID=UPI002E10C91F
MSSSLYFIIPALGGYTLTSLYLLKNPHILHRKRRTAFHCTHISHRGGSGERIESTMEAFSHAVEQGTEMLEMDCHLTRDGHVVVSHDENLLRQTGQDVTISSLSLEEMPLYKERMEVTFFAGHYSTGTDRKFALLEDVFRKFPNMPINIEIKEENTVLIQKVSDLVKQYDREEITVWATENSSIMKNCCAINTNMPYSFSISRGMQLLLLFYSGLLPFVPLGESFLQFYLPRIINSVNRARANTFLTLYWASIYIVQDIHSRGTHTEEQTGYLSNREVNYEKEPFETSCIKRDSGTLVCLQ